ncbi:transposase domain-containing protein [Paenibacillus macquariensis]|uniref:transposase domain-containing protein n=1 Tax=Paenibacillus macquariensis TaxID=948756 RepID=UPI0007C29C0E|nr:transposase domain-containing protein [Paenibacillus macquariensis]MEC0089110.1 transposase domain-containing protein [Paenibacillus macquariensis]OAB33462.1 hypothetical protein PMSM_15830 [Paenibacillus macquariensis subsp. macquariensis]
MLIFAIQNFIGNRDWPFAQSIKGAKARAIVYSIVETAKEHQLNPLIYLTHVLEQLSIIDRTDSKSAGTTTSMVEWSKSLPIDCLPNKTIHKRPPVRQVGVIRHVLS